MTMNQFSVTLLRLTIGDHDITFADFVESRILYKYERIQITLNKLDK